MIYPPWRLRHLIGRQTSANVPCSLYLMLHRSQTLLCSQYTQFLSAVWKGTTYIIYPTRYISLKHLVVRWETYATVILTHSADKILDSWSRPYNHTHSIARFLKDASQRPLRKAGNQIKCDEGRSTIGNSRWLEEQIQCTPICSDRSSWVQTLRSFILPLPPSSQYKLLHRKAPFLSLI